MATSRSCRKCWKSTCVRWPITATAITKRNSVNEEILGNKKSFACILKKVCFQIKKICLQRKRICSNRKVCLHTQNKPTANSCGKFPRQIATANSHGKTPRQIAITNICEGVPAMLLLTHLIIKRSFMFYILTYLKSWNYNTNVLVRIIVPCLNRCELLENLKFYLLQKGILIWWFLLFLWQRVNRLNWLI